MNDRPEGRPRHAGGGMKRTGPPGPDFVAVANADGVRIEGRHPGLLEQMEREIEARRVLPYTFRRYDITAAGAVEIDFAGTELKVLFVAGTTPEFRVRFNDEGNEWITITGECELRFAFTKVYLDWGAIVNGDIGILLSTVLP